MGDTLSALSIPVLLLASGVYAVCESWWRRRHPAPPSPYTHQAARLAERAVLADAETLVDDAYTRPGTLSGSPEAPDTRAPVPGITSGEAASPDPDR
ncbi:hypothetical protein AB0L71_18420 [Streptomyces sp. NPDC052052]|uniref:hypothetical protein n=1 Tax=Streptomyces sp. NPDC052052 TaxID=3154756 RepID=UPI00343A6391